MSDCLMTAEDLARVTGKKRYGKQVEWFKTEFGISVTRAADGKLSMTWVQYDALLARKNGTAGANASQPVELCYD
jgi:hypothetical protein